MEKMTMKSNDMIQENIDKIKELFPQCVKEDLVDGKKTLIVDFESLKAELCTETDESKKERYVMTWPGKKEAVLLANSFTTNTLRPNVNSSKDFWNTKNLYIEGNNFDVLKVLRETYLKKIGVIYIDPPYNTGRNILYKNDFSIDKENFTLMNNDVDEDGNIVNVNRKSEGRFHTKWLNMIYPALRIARDLLNDEGIIVLAIDDNEYANLKKMCDEVFYEGNYVGTIVTRSNPQGRGKKNIDPIHEYHLVYAKNISRMPELKIRKRGSGEIEYWNFIRGGSNSRKFERPYRFYPMLVKGEDVFVITKEEYQKIYNPSSGFDDAYMKQLQKKYEDLGYKVIWPIASNGEEKVWQRKFDRAVIEHKTYKYIGRQIKYPLEDYSTPRSVWHDDIHSNVQYGTGYLNKLFNGKDVFDFPKSIHTVYDLVSTVDAEYVMDFFAGSATTADAVMRLNAHDKSNDRKFIMVQLPENLDDNLKIVSDTEKQTILNAIEICDSLGVPHTIAEVAKERIRRCGELVKNEESFNDLDTGFRVLTLDSSNMKESFYNPSTLKQVSLFDTVSNVKEDRTDFDIIFQCMLNLGVVLDSSIIKKTIENKDIYIVGDNKIIACLESDLTTSIIEAIAKEKPEFAIFKDTSFKNDAISINTEQIFKTHSNSTIIKVL